MSEEKTKEQEKSKKAEGDPKKADAKKADKAPKGEAKAKAEAKGKGGKGKGKEEQAAEGGKKLAERPLNDYKPRVMTMYRNDVVPALRKRFNYKNVMQVPRLDRIVVNMGVGDAVEDQKHIDHAIEDMQIITGQKPSI